MAATVSSKRLKGTTLALLIDGKNYIGDVTSWTLSAEDKDADVTTFLDARSGNLSAFTLALGMVQSTDPESLFMKFWESTGQELKFALAPHGNEEASAEQPIFTGTLIVPNAPEMGGDAGNNTYTSEVECQLTGKPAKNVSGQIATLLES